MSATLQPRSSSPLPGRPAEHLLRQRLGRLRRRLRFVATARGVGWLVGCVLGTLLIVGLLDYRFHLPGLVRAFALTGMLTSCGLLFVSYLLRPLSAPMDDLSLALEVEERYPLLNDGLASTVQFLDRTPPSGESESMRREAVRRTLHKIDTLDFNRVVDAHGLKWALALALIAIVATIGLAVVWPHLAGTALARLAAPFSEFEWPRKTRIDLGEVVERIGRNREYRLIGRLGGEIPREVTLEVGYEGFPPQKKALAVHPDEHTFLIHLKPEEVQRNFRFRVLANDAATREYLVEVLPLPVLVALDSRPSPQIHLEPPAYTDLPSPQHLPAGTGNLDLVAGTLVTFRAAVDRPLQRAWIEFQPETQGAALAACLAPLASSFPPGVLGSFVLSRGLYEKVPATLEQDRRRLQVVFRPRIHGSYTLYFEDEHGLENSRSYELRLRLDPAPVVKLERPSPSRDVLSVLPNSRLPLQVIFEDPQFAIRSAWLEYRNSTEETPRGFGLYHHARGIARDAGIWTGVAALGAPTPRLRLQRLQIERVLPVRGLTRSDGSPPKEGDVIILQLFADDFDDVSVGKEPGKSHQVTIRIVGREALDNELNREQGRIQKDLVTLRDRQREALGKVREIEARVRKGGPLVPERESVDAENQAAKLRQEAAAEKEKAEKATNDAEREKHQQAERTAREQAEQQEQKAKELKRQATQLGEAEQLQQQVRERAGNEREGLRAEVERLRETLRQNGMENSNAMERMSQVARELDRLAEKELELIEPRLHNARRMAELQDARTREEKQAELMKEARAAEEERKAAEERARKLTERADTLEKENADAQDPRKEEEAKRLREEARGEREKAAERQAQAEKNRREAAEAADPEKPRRTLAEARRGQEEVERSLSQLLQELEPWSSTLEVNSEAGRILQEQKDLQGQLEELAGKGMTGKNRDELTEGEKADLDGAKDAQKRLQERTASLLAQMKRLAEERATRDPDTARDLKKAAEQAEENNLAGQMRAAQESIGQNKLNDARRKQREAIAELEKLQRTLKDSREARLDRLGRKLREAEEMVERLMDEQEKLQRKMREAGAITDPNKRDEELKKLARKQQELRKKTEEAIQQLSRLGNDRAREAMLEAREEMGDAVKQLSRGKRDDEKQDDVLDRLEEARREIERARKKAEEELGREQIIRVADVIRRLHERQGGHVQEAKRIQDAVLLRKGWRRDLKASLRTLGEVQKGLGEETMNVARKDLTSAPVFARLVERAARSMDRAGQRLSALVTDSPPLEAIPDADLAREQALALRRLEQLLESLKEAANDPRPLSRGGEGGGEGEEGRQPQGDDSIPSPAQLKLLRAMQNEVNERTEAFRKKHPDTEKLGPKDKAELDEIRQEQKEVADLLERLTRPPGEEPIEEDKEAKEGDAKP